MKKLNGQAVSEVMEIINHSEEKIIDKIPRKFIEFLNNNKDEKYKANIDFTNDSWKNHIKADTKTIIAMIYRDYIVDENKRKELIEKEIKEEKKLEEEKKEKYNTDNLFQKKTRMENKNNIEPVELIEIKKTSWYKRIFNKILKFFGVKK